MKYTNYDKAELHCHLNGSIPINTILKIIDNNYDFKEHDYIIDKPVKNLSEYFNPWKITRLLPHNKNIFMTILDGIGKEMLADNIKYIELRNSIIYLAKLNNITYEEILDWHIEGFETIKTKYKLDMRLIISVRREVNEINEYYKILDIIKRKNSNIFVGFDLTGNETELHFSEWPNFFQNVKENGYGITIHAGESWSDENVKYAITQCKANRIGHGLAIGNSPELLDLCKKNDICLEVCLTSNILTSSVSDISTHPVLLFHKFNIPYVLCSDNPGIHNKSLSFEYELFENITKISNFAEVMYRNQLKYAFKNLR